MRKSPVHHNQKLAAASRHDNKRAELISRYVSSAETDAGRRKRSDEGAESVFGFRV